MYACSIGIISTDNLSVSFDFGTYKNKKTKSGCFKLLTKKNSLTYQSPKHKTVSFQLFTHFKMYFIVVEEENWNDGDVVWEEFATIATDLLERINAHLEST